MAGRSAKAPRVLNWSGLAAVAVGVLCLLAFYEAFGRALGGSDPLFLIAWALMGLGVVATWIASFWAWRRGDRGRPVGAIIGLVVLVLAIGVMLFMAALAS